MVRRHPEDFLVVAVTFCAGGGGGGGGVFAGVVTAGAGKISGVSSIGRGGGGTAGDGAGVLAVFGDVPYKSSVVNGFSSVMMFPLFHPTYVFVNARVISGQTQLHWVGFVRARLYTRRTTVLPIRRHQG